MATSNTARNTPTKKEPRPSSTQTEAAAEQIRLNRLREDANQPASANLAETIALSHQAIQLAEDFSQRG